MFLIKQKKSLHGGLAAVSVVLLGGCVGGSFDLLELDLNPPPPAASKKPARKAVRRNAEEQNKLLQPASGFAMRSVRRNSAKFDKNGNAIPNNGEAEQRLALDGSGLMAIEGVELSEIEGGFKKSSSSFSRVDTNENNCHILCKELKNHPDEKRDDGRISDISNSGSQQKDNYQHIRFGYVSSDSSNSESKLTSGNKTVERQGNHFYTYYYGVNPSASLPMGTVKYSGEWFFMTDAVKNRKDKTCTTQGQECIKSIFPLNTGFSGDYSSASRFGNTGTSNTKYSADFSVDFSTKKLTGNLNYSSNTTPSSTVYTIISDAKGKPILMDPNILLNATRVSKNKTPSTLKVETISDSSKQHQETAIILDKQLIVPLAFPHFQTHSGALYGAKIDKNKTQPIYRKANELDFNVLHSGKAQYQGIAIGFKENKTDFDIGSITLNADFNSKNISGTISREDGTQIELQQTSITNDNNNKAKYSGNAKTTISNVDKTGTYEGNFFGHYLSKRASDTVGKVTFADPDYLSMGFNGRKQKK